MRNDYLRLALIGITFLSLSYCVMESMNNHVQTIAPATQYEWSAPVPEHKTDSETWDTTGRVIIMRGCKEWRARDPNADC